MIALIFVLFVMYTLACIADGPDVKPLWKQWLGVKLLKLSRKYIKVYECVSPYNCGFVKYEHKKSESLGQRLIQQENIADTLRKHIYEIQAMRADGILQVRKHNVIVSEGELISAHHRALAFGGNPEYELIESAKKVCVETIIKSLRDQVVINVDTESMFPDTVVKGMLVLKRWD